MLHYPRAELGGHCLVCSKRSFACLTVFSLFVIHIHYSDFPVIREIVLPSFDFGRVCKSGEVGALGAGANQRRNSLLSSFFCVDDLEQNKVSKRTLS